MVRTKLQVVNKSRSEKYKKEEPVIQKEETKKKKKKKEENTKKTRKKEQTKPIKISLKNTKEKEIQESNDLDEKTETTIIKKVFIFLLIILIIFISYSMFIEPNLLKINEHKIETNKITESYHGLKVVQFSDINYGTSFNEKDLEKLINKINELKPDIVIFTGNLIDKNIKIDNKNKKILIKHLSKIETTLYKYAIYGKSDNNNTFKEIMAKTNFTILNNESKLIYNGDETPIVLIGFNNNQETDYSIINKPIDEIDITNFYKIVLSHSQDITDKILMHNPDLILSGSTLGGIINLGFTKPLFLEKNTKYYENYYNLNNTKLYISNGLGTDEFNLRFNNVPSINFFRFYKI